MARRWKTTTRRQPISDRITSPPFHSAYHQIESRNFFCSINTKSKLIKKSIAKYQILVLPYVLRTSAQHENYFRLGNTLKKFFSSLWNFCAFRRNFHENFEASWTWLTHLRTMNHRSSHAAPVKFTSRYQLSCSDVNLRSTLHSILHCLRWYTGYSKVSLSVSLKFAQQIATRNGLNLPISFHIK